MSVFINRTTAEQKFRFSDLLLLQENTLKKIQPERQSALLLAELAPTVTLGARQVHDESQQAEIEQLRNQLEKKGIALVEGARGGKETWHGPGQWVGFVLTPLLEFTGDSRGVRKAVYQILERVLSVAQQWNPDLSIEDDERLGIWSKAGKVASVGIKIRDGYTTSGFALNCYPTETSFFGIHPCGLQGERADFLFQELPQEEWEAEFMKVAGALQAEFEKRFAALI